MLQDSFQAHHTCVQNSHRLQLAWLPGYPLAIGSVDSCNPTCPGTFQCSHIFTNEDVHARTHTHFLIYSLPTLAGAVCTASLSLACTLGRNGVCLALSRTDCCHYMYIHWQRSPPDRAPRGYTLLQTLHRVMYSRTLLANLQHKETNSGTCATRFRIIQRQLVSTSTDLSALSPASELLSSFESTTCEHKRSVNSPRTAAEHAAAKVDVCIPCTTPLSQ